MILNVEEDSQEYIAGSLLIPESQLATRAAEIPKDKKIILCYPRLSKQYDPLTRAAMILAENGVENKVMILGGGLEGWKRQGYAIITR